MKEKWRVIKDYPDYAVSNFGNVRRVVKGIKNGVLGPLKIRLEKPPRHTKFRPHVVLYRNTIPRSISISHLVAASFISKRPKGYEVNHKDGNPENNCAWNLEYLTPDDNHQHALRMNLFTYGENVHFAKLNPKKIREIRSLYPRLTTREIGTRYNINHAGIWRIIKRINWKQVA